MAYLFPSFPVGAGAASPVNYIVSALRFQNRTATGKETTNGNQDRLRIPQAAGERVIRSPFYPVDPPR